MKFQKNTILTKVGFEKSFIFLLARIAFKIDYEWLKTAVDIITRTSATRESASM